MAKAIDIGTSTMISAVELKTKTKYQQLRDAFYTLKPSSPIAAKIIEKGLEGKTYYKRANEFILVGQDAIEKAVERKDSAQRPLVKGVISPKERDAFDVLKFIISKLLGSPVEKGEKVAFSIPAQPIDKPQEEFDVKYHAGVFQNLIESLGYTAEPITEGTAVGYANLLDDGLTGANCSFGAGQCNVSVLSDGEEALAFSLTQGGDYVDRMVAQATLLTDSTVQVEKEAGGYDLMADGDTLNKYDPVHKALVIYYRNLINYFWVNFTNYLTANKDKLPTFKESIPLIVSGGTSLAPGFVEYFTSRQRTNPCFTIKEIRHAENPLYAVAKGCLFYAGL